jgi:hypothetical protein
MPTLSTSEWHANTGLIKSTTALIQVDALAQGWWPCFKGTDCTMRMTESLSAGCIQHWHNDSDLKTAALYSSQCPRIRVNGPIAMVPVVPWVWQTCSHQDVPGINATTWAWRPDTYEDSPPTPVLTQQLQRQLALACANPTTTRSTPPVLTQQQQVQIAHLCVDLPSPVPTQQRQVRVALARPCKIYHTQPSWLQHMLLRAWCFWCLYPHTLPHPVATCSI